jgi:hypothetical protein
MRAFFVSSEYISDLIARLNLTPAAVMSASAPNPTPASATDLPSTTFEFHNAARAIPAFSISKARLYKVSRGNQEELYKANPIDPISQPLSIIVGRNAPAEEISI